MEFEFEELTHENYEQVRQIDREDIPVSFVHPAATIMAITDYGVEHGFPGHTFAVKVGERCVGLILLAQTVAWETDPPEMAQTPFYRLMGFVLDRAYRGHGLGGAVLERAVEEVYRDFGPRPIVLGCHRDNHTAARFYRKHGFQKTEYMETDDFYYLRFPKQEAPEGEETPWGT